MITMKLKKPEEKINPKQVAEKRKALMDSLTEELEAKGVVFFKPEEMLGTLHIDSSYLSLPSVLTDIPSRELGNYLNAFTQHRMYMRTLLGWQECQVEDSKRNYYNASHEKYLELTQTKISETAKERILNNTAGIHELFLAYKDEKKRLQLLEYNMLSIDDAVFSLSREISRRGFDISVENRNENIQARKRR